MSSLGSNVSEESDFHTLYPNLEGFEDSDSVHNDCNELEGYFESLTKQHRLYIEARNKDQVGEQIDITVRCGEDLIALETNFRAKLKTLTQAQFQETEKELEKRYVIILNQIYDFLEQGEFKRCNINSEKKTEFKTLFKQLDHTVKETNTFREQKLLPDQFRILRATGTGVQSKLLLRNLALQRELDEERINFNKKLNERVDSTEAELKAAVKTKNNLRNEIEDYTNQIRKLEQHNSQLVAETVRLETRIKYLETESEYNDTLNDTTENSFANQAGQYENQLTRANQDIKKLQDTIQEKDSVLESTLTSEANLKQILKIRDSKFDKQLNKQKEDFEKQILLIKEEKDRIEKSAEQYKKLVDLIGEQAVQNHTELVNLFKELEGKQDSINLQYSTSVGDIQNHLQQILGEINNNIDLSKEVVFKVNNLRQGAERTLHEDLLRVSENSEAEEEEEEPGTFSSLVNSTHYRLSYFNTPDKVELRESEKTKALTSTIVNLEAKVVTAQTEINRLNHDLEIQLTSLNESRERILRLNQIIEQNQIMPQANNMDELTRNLGELFSREDKKTINYFNGQSDGKSIHEWLDFSNRVAVNNGWTDSQKIRFYSDRLTDDAIRWHNEYMADLPDDPNTGDLMANPIVPRTKYTIDTLPYAVWEKAFLKRFTNKSQIEKLRNRLNMLRQNSDQEVQSYISNINSLYNIVNGKASKLEATATPGEKRLYLENEKLRSQDKLKILLKGILPSIKNEMWPRMPANPTYEEACFAALDAENVCINKELAEDKGLTAVVAGISLHGEQQDLRIKKQEAEIELLKNNIKTLTINNNLSQGMDSGSKLIAAVIEERPQSRIRFDRSSSGDRNDYNNRREKIVYDRSRSSSPFNNRYSKDQRERFQENNRGPVQRGDEERRRSNFDLDRGQRNNQTNFNRNRDRYSNWRDRSQPESRDQSWDRRSAQFTNRRFNPINQVQNNQFRPIERRPFNQDRRGSFNRPNSFGNRRESLIQRRQFDSPFGSRENITGKTSQNNCFYCGKPGHLAKQCRLRLRNQPRGRGLNYRK